MTTYLVFQKLAHSNRRGCVGSFLAPTGDAGAVRAALEAWLERQGTNNARRIFTVKTQAEYARGTRVKGK